jgi:hypothetical protein
LIAAADAAEVAAPAVTVAEAVPLGYAARKAAPTRSSWAAWLRPAYGLAAAAVVVLAVVWVTLPGRTGDDAIRSSELLAISPSGTADAQLFRWESPYEAARYRVTVRDANGGVVLTAEAPKSPWPVALELQGRLKAGGTYTWQVAALDAAGELIAESKPATFQFRP